MKPRGLQKTILTLASVAFAGLLAAAQPAQSQDISANAGASTQVGQTSTDSKNPLVVRIDPARVLDSSGQSVGKIENIVLSQSGCADAVIITGDRGRLIPVPWQIVKVGG